MRKCSGCEKTFEIGARERKKRRWCSESCRVKAWHEAHPDSSIAMRERQAVRLAAARASTRGKCQSCGDPLKRGGSTAYCAERECQKARQRDRERQRYAADREARVERSRAARASMTDAQRVSARATQRAWYAKAGYSEAKRSADQRRRAIKLGATVEKFKAFDVFERDGWRCGICARTVDRSLPWPDPLSASLDHIEPLSLGGAHSAANTRLAHLICNVRRGNRIEAEQLALI